MKVTGFIFTFIIIFLAVVSCAGPDIAQNKKESFAGEQPSKASSLDTVYKLGPGDRIKVTVFGEEDLSGEFQVDGSGNISFPLIGEVRVEGLSIHELELCLEKKLKNGYLINPRVSVEVLNYRPFYILGEVKNPGQYEYVNGLTLYNAVAIAGGYTYRARRNRATITRVVNGKEVTFEANHSTLILPGDVIYIRERFF